jgi:hypothetical protein
VIVHSGLFRVDMIDHGPVLRATDPELPGWTGPPMDRDWHRHETCDQRRRPARH